MNIQGMTCSSCVHTIETGLVKMPGIESAVVTLNTARGKIKINTTKIGPRDVIQYIKDLGYEASLAHGGNKRNYLDHSKEIRKWR